MRSIGVRITGLVMGALLVAVGSGARAETSVERSESYRVVMAFRVQTEAAQSRLPEGWMVRATPSGPFQGANAYVVFTERLTEQSREGGSREGSRYAGIAISAANPAAGKSGMMVVRQLSNLDGGSTGPYRNTRRAQLRRRTGVEATTDSLGIGSEAWEVAPADGGSISFSLRFTRSVPIRQERELRGYSATDASIERIYKLTEVSEVLYSEASSVDRTKERRIEIRVPELATLFDGKQQLVGIIVQPLYSREVLLP
jgi:hypothetical protein